VNGPHRPFGSVEAWLVTLIAMHSYAVGAALLFAPGFGARLGGWGEVAPLFFMRQAGVFHFLVATVYLVEWRRFGTVSFLLFAKCVAVLFLGTLWLVGDQPWVVPFSGLADGMMAIAVLVARRRGRSTVRSRAP
jgi:hypothetical protein